MRSFRKILAVSASALVLLALGLWTYDIRVIQPHRADIEEILNTANVQDREPSAAVRARILGDNPGLSVARFRVARELVGQFIPTTEPDDLKSSVHIALWSLLIRFHRSDADILGLYCTLSLRGCGRGIEPLAVTSCIIKGLSLPAHCGSLDVTENPQRPDGRHLQIQVTVLPAETTPALPDPIVVLMGGPGEDAIGSAADFAQQFASLHQDRDLVFVDQRGTGRSGALHCDLASPDRPAANLRDLFPVAAVQSCAHRWSVQADLTQYSYTHFANDLEQVRLALGYGPLNLFAGSYGTRAAQVFIRSYPNSVRTAFLGSVVPIDVAIPGPFTVTSQAALEQTLEACLADSDCTTAFPNIRGDFADMAALLDTGQTRVHIPGSTQTALLDRGRVAEWFRSKLYRPRSAASLPWLIHRAAGGDWSPVVDGILTDSAAADSALSFGLLFSITCSDDIPFVNEQDLGPDPMATFLKDYRLRQQQAACAVWPRAAVPAGYRLPVVTSVPTLFVSGDSDGGTPLWFMEHAAKGFSRHATLIERNQGHTEWNLCVSRKYDQFVEQGSVSKIETGDCQPVPRPAFKTH